MIQNFLNIGIEPKGNRPSQKVKCPNCVKVGKKTITDTPLSIDLISGLYHCHRCGWSGCVADKPQNNYNFIPKKVKYQIPNKTNFTKLSDEALKFFTNRGITQEVVIANKIAMSKDGKSIIFPYIRNGVLVNFKQRFLDAKDFRQGKDAEPIMYNYDRCKGQKELILNEGEGDSMAYEVAGFTNVTSVNQGAPNVNDKNIDKKLECVTNCYELFEEAEKIYLATDNDPNGRRLRDELIRRFGAEKCFLVDFNDCKDANEYLLKYGALELKKTIENAKEVPVEGVFTSEDVKQSMLDSFRNGKRRGTTTYWDVIDKAWTWRTQEVNIWTGYQNEGKSLFLQSLCLLKAFHDGDSFAFFTPENLPMDDFFDDVIETFVGKSSDPMFKGNQMSEREYLDAIYFINDKFYLIYPEKDFTIDTIFDKTKFLVRKKGIRHLIIDPYNTVEHKMSDSSREDLYISKFMANLKRFAIENDISIHLVAHQKTPIKDSGGKYIRPDLNAIKGGGTFSDKADNVCFVWRPDRALDFKSTAVTVGSQKIKKQKLVGVPQDIEFIEFNRKTNRYYFNGRSPFDEVDRIRAKQKEVVQESLEFNVMSQSDAIKPNTSWDLDLNNLQVEDDCPF